MTEPGFPVRITRGVPVVIAPDEIDITKAEGRQVRLAVTGAQVRRILALTALDRLIPVRTSLDQALDHPPAGPSRAAREQDR